MRRRYAHIVSATVAVFVGTHGPTPARADFYTLDGKFACLDGDASVCADRGHAADQLVPRKPADSPGTAPAETSAPSNDPLIQAPPALNALHRAESGTSHDPMRDIAAHIEAGKPSSEDLQRLRTLSRSGDARAIELLAWCDYFGIGLPRDPVRAYIMYGIASLAGVAGASANQAVIYAYVLTPTQRQMVLDIQNDDIDGETAP